MIDLNKPSFIKGYIARAIGSCIEALQSERSAHYYKEAAYKQNKARQEAELKLYRQQWVSNNASR